MKKTNLYVFGVLLLALQMVGAGSPVHEVHAVDPNWLAEATTSSPGGFAYSVEITPASLVTQDEYFPSSTTIDPYYTYAYDTGRLSLSFEWETTGMYVPMIGETRADYMTLGFTTDNFGFLNGLRNMGRLTKVGFDIDESHYSDIQTELAGAIGLQLREGKNADYSDAENEAAGPTAVNYTTGVIEWDLTWRAAEHPGQVPFFVDESRLDDISNFRLITLEEVYFDRVYVEGYHFFEAFNGTPYYYAMWEDYYVNEAWGLNFNVDNRTDTDFEIDGSSALTPILLEAEQYVLHDIPFAVDSEDGAVYMELDVPVVVVDIALPLMELTLNDPETTPDMPVSITGWTIALAGATYGNQTIETSYLDGTRNVEIETYFGPQQANISFFSGTVLLDVNVTNSGVNIAPPDPQPMGGTLMSTVTYSENVDTVDHYEGEDPAAYYTAYTFNSGGYLTLAPGYESQGTKVQEMHFTIEILARTPDSSGGSSNAFSFWLRDRNGASIDDTFRFLEIQDDDTTVYLDFVNLSAYKIVTFYMETADIKDAILTLKLSMTGEEYDENYFSNEDQALFYAQSFNSMTDSVGGETEDGVCDGLLDTEWAVLANEYDYMSTDTQALLSNNGTKMKSTAISGMLDRYQYFTNINPTLYTDFMTGGMDASSNILSQQAEGFLPILALFGMMAVGYMALRKRRYA